MGFYIVNGIGDSEDDPSLSVMRRFIKTLDSEDREHGAAWVCDEAHNVLHYDVSGNLHYAREGAEDRHMKPVPVERVLELWQKLANGELAELEAEPWQQGHSPPISAEERDAMKRERAEWQLASDREFYDALGAERPDVPCRSTDCTRGAVSQSVFCRRHHFQSMWKRLPPFDD